MNILLLRLHSSQPEQVKYSSFSLVRVFISDHYAASQGLYTADVRQINNTKVQNLWLLTLHAGRNLNFHQKIQENENFDIPKRGENGLILQL